MPVDFHAAKEHRLWSRGFTVVGVNRDRATAFAAGSEQPPSRQAA